MTRRGPYGPGTARRAEILDAALTLFGEVGYRAASVREIAARAGMSHPGLLRHFPRKALLLEAVLAEHELRIAEEFGVGDDDPLRLLRSYVAVSRRNAASPRVVELFTSLAAEATDPAHPAHDYFTDRYRRMRGALTTTLQRLADAGALRPDIEPASAAADVLAHSDGLQIQWLLDPDVIDLEAATRRYVQSLLTIDLGTEPEPGPDDH